MSTRRSGWAHKNAPALETHPITRDLDGNVHTPSGFLPHEAYDQVRADNPGAGLPLWEHIPYRVVVSSEEGVVAALIQRVQ